MQKFKNWEKKYNFTKTDLGLTNDNYLLDHKFLLRKSSAKTNFFIQRKNEIEILKLLIQKKINVPVLEYFFDAEGNFIYVTKFLPQGKNFAQVKKSKENFQKIANLIQKLHSINYQKSKITQLDMHQNLFNHIKLSEYDGKNENLNLLITTLTTFLKKFNWKEKIILSHNDPLKENFLIDENEKYYLIDYEYCALNTSYYDVGVFASANGLVYELDWLWYWLSLFQIVEANEIKKTFYFILYRDVLGYFWAKCMLKNNPHDKYHKLMLKKLAQAQETLLQLKKISIIIDG